MSRDLQYWPNCAIADCPNKACLHLDSKFCWPHTVGMPIDWSTGIPEILVESVSQAIEYEYLEARG
jgi:hypothetical protein